MRGADDVHVLGTRTNLATMRTAWAHRRGREDQFDVLQRFERVQGPEIRGPCSR